MSDIKNQFNSSNFENTTFNYDGKKISKALGDIPAIPNLFIGRANVTVDIHQKLNKNNNLLLLVNGNGGIGKTTIASQYYFEYAAHYAHLIWLVSEKGIKEAIVSLALSLKIGFPDKLTQAQQINEILRTISELNKPILLIIDNANDINDLDENFRLLRQFHHIHILITSRIDSYPHIDTYPIKHLDKKSANDLFKYHFEAFKSKEQELLEEILEAIGYNTLVIELLAKNLSEFNNGIKDHYPLKKLLEDIQQKGVLAIRKSTKVVADYKLHPAKAEDIIRSMYDISQLSENEKSILSIFALLPATSIMFKYLELFLPNMEELDRVLLKLSQKGWIDYDKEFNSFKTNPIISEIAREQNKDRLEEDTGSLVYILISKLNYELGVGHIAGDFNEINNFVLYTETVVNNFKVLNYSKSVLLERLGNFYKTYGNLDKALTFFEDDLNLSRELYESNPNNVDLKNSLAIAYENLGSTHSSLGNLDKALKFFKERSRLAKELYDNNPNNVTLKNGLAIAYSKLGDTHTSLGNLDKALKLFEDQTKLFEELYKSNPDNVIFKNGLTVSYEKLGDTHTALGNLDKALTFFEDKLKLNKELYESNPNNVEFKHNLAIAYERLGDTHTALEDLDKALKFFKERSRLGKELYESNPNNVSFKNGLAIAYFKLGSTHTSLGNLDKALKFLEDYLKLRKELYESNSNNVRFKNGLAIAYLNLAALFIDKLNSKNKGIDLLNKARELLKELVDKHPKYAEFKRNYIWVINKIKNIE